MQAFGYACFHLLILLRLAAELLCRRYHCKLLLGQVILQLALPVPLIDELGLHILQYLLYGAHPLAHFVDLIRCQDLLLECFFSFCFSVHIFIEFTKNTKNYKV